VQRADIVDNYWLDTKTPNLTYGLRGINYYEIKVSGPDRDLHSGAFGGTIHEPMTDLILVSKSPFPCFVGRTLISDSVEACFARRQDLDPRRQ
jgi:hypothetical protein